VPQIQENVAIVMTFVAGFEYGSTAFFRRKQAKNRPVNGQ
jgi:hypothetical protein